MLRSAKRGKRNSKSERSFDSSESKNYATNMTNQIQMRALAREALKLVKAKAPAIVDERILAQALDEVAEYTADIMGKLTNLDAENDKTITMAHGIIRDGLLGEIIDQITKVRLKEADKRITKLFKK